MSKTIPAARQLVSQVLVSRGKGVEYEMSDMDGLGRFRAVTFDEHTSRWLDPILQAADDRRIASTDMKGKKGHQKLTVTFVANVYADGAEEYKIAEADEVLNEPDEPDEDQ